MKKSVSVDIYGERYPLIGEADEQYVRELARYVDSKIREVATQSKASDPRKMAVLAAVNIAHELFQLRENQAVTEREIEGRTVHLIERLETYLSDLSLA